jgi:ankyrin repeat protein
LERVDLAAFEQDKPMKTKWLAGYILLAGAMILRAATNDLTAALQKGLFEEEANRNLDAAISNYQALAMQFDRDRQIAATAIFRLGECYRKLGQTNEAVVQYQRIVREFSNQQTLATLSRQNLAGLGSVSKSDAEKTSHLASPESAAASAATVVTDDEEQEIRRIRAMIQNSPDLINAPVKIGDAQLTPLGHAANNGQLRVAQFLLDSGAEVNRSRDFNSWPPLLIAAANGHKAMVELLLAKGADVNSRDSSGQTALHLAAENGFQSVAEALLANKADVNARDKNQVTPLHLAARKGHSAMVAFLLVHQAEPNAQDAKGQTSVSLAAQAGHSETLNKLLAAGARPDVEDSNGLTPLSYAADDGHLDSVKALLEAKANPDAGKIDLPLAQAMWNKHLEIAELLLRTGADPNRSAMATQRLKQPGARDEFYPSFPYGPYTPLQIAVAQGDIAMVKLLFQFKANPNAKEPWTADANPLTFSALQNVEMLKAFLAAGADPNAAHASGRSLLFVAAADQNADAVAALLAKGAQVNPPSNSEFVPLLAAISESPAGTNTVKLLLDAKADVNARSAGGNTPLLRAMEARNPAVAKLLLDRGADPNLAYKNGYTPLHCAVNVENTNLMQLLLDHKADPNLRNNEGRTPLDLVKEQDSRSGILTIPQRPGLRSFPGTSQSSQPAPSASLADLLRQHGAVDNLPRWDQISVSRPAMNFSAMVFQKGTNNWNRFTLLETILNYYDSQKTYSVPAGNNTWNGYPADAMMPFPDLTRVVIVRHTHGTTNETRVKINLLDNTNGIDCSKDVTLEFGDVMEIPEREHALGEASAGLMASQRAAMANCLKGSVQLVVRDQKVQLSLYPYPYSSLIGSVLNSSEAKKVLLSSSDLSRVKMTRCDPKTGKRLEWVINCAPSPEAVPVDAGSTFSQRLQAITELSRSGGQFGAAPDLWLRDGDVIEVPEKP